MEKKICKMDEFFLARLPVKAAVPPEKKYMDRDFSFHWISKLNHFQFSRQHISDSVTMLPYAHPPDTATSSEESTDSDSSISYKGMQRMQLRRQLMFMKNAKESYEIQEKLKNEHISRMDSVEKIGKTQKQLDKEYETILSFWIRTQLPNFRYIPKCILQFIFKFSRLSPEGIWIVQRNIEKSVDGKHSNNLLPEKITIARALFPNNNCMSDTPRPNVKHLHFSFCKEKKRENIFFPNKSE